MKPLKLIMNAFGAFYNETTIDFTNLNQDGIYLISGPTGSGKTTIFDAITFALYGTTSGDSRDTSIFRSDYASDNDKTFVKFTFSKSGKEYTVERNPSYKYDDGPYGQSSYACLYLPDNKNITGILNVNYKIEEIIGLNVRQFKQVVMLAQGEFMKLIHADSKARDEVFRQIFNTKHLQILNEKIKESLRDSNYDIILANRTIIETLDQLSSYIKIHSSYSCTPELLQKTLDNIQSQFKQLKIKEKELNSKLKDIMEAKEKLLSTYHLQKSYHEKHQHLLQTKESINNLIKEEPKIKEKTNTLDKLNDCLALKDLYLNLDNASKALKSQDEELTSLKHKLEEVNNNLIYCEEQKIFLSEDRKKIEEIKALIIEYNEELKVLNQIEEKSFKVSSLSKELKEHIQTKNILTSELEKLKETLNEITLKEVDNNNLNLQVVNLNHDLNNQTKELNNLNEDLQALIDLKAKEASLLTYVKNYQEQCRLLTTYQVEEKEVELNYFNSLTYLLAEELKEGYPCPVCGSTTHPNKATSKGQCTKKDLDDAKLKTSTQQKIKDDAFSKLEHHQSLFNSLLLRYTNKYNQSTINDLLKEVKNKIKKINTSINNLNIELTTLTNLIKTNEGIINDKPTLQKEQEINEHALKNIEQKISSIEGTINHLHQEIDTQSSLIKTNMTKDDLSSCIIDLEDGLNELIKCVEEFDKFFDENTTIKATIDESLKESQNKYTLLKEEVNTLNTTYEQALINSSLKDLSKDALLKMYSQVENISKIQSEVSSYYTMLDNLNNTFKTLNEELKDITLIDLTSLEDQINDLNNELTDCEKEHLKASKLNATISTYYKALKNCQKTFNFKYEHNIMLTNIYNAISGKNPLKLSFERYVMLYHFEQILKFANIRLRRMTNDRYLLLRKNVRNAGNSQSGLDLLIFDYETGKARDVKTLSGGETFKAALALSLGLSDAIESRTGGVEIDTLFIDEGFGTLDDESLHNAIEILNELRGDNKSIGIISHVQELTNLISSKIIVSKAEVGSKIKIIN